MQSAANPNRQQPENLIGELAARMRRHLVWDTLWAVVPLALAGAYAAIALYRAARLSETAIFFTAAALAGLVLGALLVRLRLRRPNLVATARLADGKSGAQDHFLTLSTIDRETCSPSLVSRLRRDAANFGDRIEFKRDFPYRLKRSSYASLVAALLLGGFIHWAAPIGESMMAPVSRSERLRQLAKQMAERPELGEIARELASLAAKLENPDVSAEEKKALIQELEKKLAEQQTLQEQAEQQEMLAQAAETLAGSEERQSTGGEKKEEQQKGGGEIESNLPQNGKGESKASPGGSGESKDDRSAQLSQDIQEGKSAKAGAKDPSQDKDPNTPGDTKSDQPDKSPREKEPKTEASKDQGEAGEKSGRQQASEDPPQGTPPQDRFYKPGEGKEGIKGTRYVTVQLPEEIAAETKGEGKAAREGKRSGASGKLPASNVPLPPHVPNVPREKQELPLEYRGIIR